MFSIVAQVTGDRESGLVMIVMGLLAVAVASLALGAIYFWVTGRRAEIRFDQQGASPAKPPRPDPTGPAVQRAPATLFGTAAAHTTLLDADHLNDEPASLGSATFSDGSPAPVGGGLVPRPVMTSEPPPVDSYEFAVPAGPDAQASDPAAAPLDRAARAPELFPSVDEPQAVPSLEGPARQNPALQEPTPLQDPLPFAEPLPVAEPLPAVGAAPEGEVFELPPMDLPISEPRSPETAAQPLLPEPLVAHLTDPISVPDADLEDPDAIVNGGSDRQKLQPIVSRLEGVPLPDDIPLTPTVSDEPATEIPHW